MKNEFHDGWVPLDPEGFWWTCFVATVSNLTVALQERGEQSRDRDLAEQGEAIAVWGSGNDVY